MFENAETYLNSETNFYCINDRPVPQPSLVKWAHAHLRTVWWKCPSPKTARQKSAKSSITQTWITQFRSNSVQSLNTSHPKCCKSSRSRGQGSRSQHDIVQKFAKLSILIQARIARFRIIAQISYRLWSRHLMYHELSRSTGQRSRSLTDMTYQHNKRYNSGTDKLSIVKLCEK